MKLDLTPFENWESLNERLAVELQYSENSLRAYSGAAAAIYELAMSTAQFYSHKRSVGFVEGQTPYLIGLLPYLYKEGYQVQVAPAEASLDWKAWVEGLKKDTNFVAFCEDHPVTGEVYDVGQLEIALNEKKIFCLRISHNQHLFKKIEIQPYSARICSYQGNTAVAILGAKFRSPPLMAQSMDWSLDDFIKSIQISRTSHEDKALIQNFEKTLPSPFQQYLKTESRLFDRALFYCEEITGEALQQFLKKELNQPLLRAGLEKDIETTHLCRWGGHASYEPWWKPTPKPEVLRGLTVISADLIQKTNLKDLLSKAVKELQF
jgi:hypothetical protein